MPPSGGSADKFGNRYEALWAIDQLLRVVEGTAATLTLEPIDPDLSQGIEFILESPSEKKQFWSVKRQNTQGHWSLHLLTNAQTSGRSILGDLAWHVGKSSLHQAYFASSVAAAALSELHTYADDETRFRDRLKRNAGLREEFNKYILPITGRDESRARELLTRVHCRITDEEQLRDRIEQELRQQFYPMEGGLLDAAAVRAILADFLERSIHVPVRRENILSELAAHRVGRRDWSQEPLLLDRVKDLCVAYMQPVQQEFIAGKYFPLTDTAAIISEDGLPKSTQMLIVSAAGGGKSSMLAHIVEHFIATSVPVVVLRFDQISGGILSTAERQKARAAGLSSISSWRNSRHTPVCTRNRSARCS